MPAGSPPTCASAHTVCRTLSDSGRLSPSSWSTVSCVGCGWLVGARSLHPFGRWQHPTKTTHLGRTHMCSILLRGFHQTGPVKQGIW